MNWQSIKSVGYPTKKGIYLVSFIQSNEFGFYRRYETVYFTGQRFEMYHNNISHYLLIEPPNENF